MTTPHPILRSDYRPPDYRVDQVDLHFELDAENTLVHATLQLRRGEGVAASAPLVLNGAQLELLDLQLDGEPVAAGRYCLDGENLVLERVPEHFSLTVKNRIHPADNTALEGLYQSGGLLCTQCEAEGFRRITYFPDRPDIMARYCVTLSADRQRYPVLLANGNPVARGEGEGGRHWVRWEDPFPKPSYLFAVVAGDLVCIEDSFLTRSGRRVALHIYVEPRNRELCAHAMASLKQAMRWDEQAYGREYDLDIFMLVAVDAFNMGAMENKGLNIFNARYVLASEKTATDQDYEAIRDVIGHEYFHNWTGNRITCRDWFQLSLKEGLTVFREQQFSETEGSAAIRRIQQARLLRTQQFAEDAGPLAHPVRPDSYLEINNFYTLTVYEKGAEIVRMLHTLLGGQTFRRGMDLYFERHDGQAVTIEDFIAAMEAASGRNLTQFRLWYSQAGTPVVLVEDEYDMESASYRLHLKQSCPTTPEQPERQPMLIPLRIGLLGSAGKDSLLPAEQVIELSASQQTVVFGQLHERPVPALQRGFSAPVRLQYAYDDAQLRQLLADDLDPYTRWDAAQQLYLRQLQAGSQDRGGVEVLAGTLRGLLTGNCDPALLAEVLQLPAEAYVAEQQARADIRPIIAAWNGLRHALGTLLQADFRARYEELAGAGRYRFEPDEVARRRLRAVCLWWLAASGDTATYVLCARQFHESDNMTDTLAALAALNDWDCAERDTCMREFRERWSHDALVMDKWLALEGHSRRPGAASRVQALLQDAAFDFSNPNRIRALLGSFSQHNFSGFHDADGHGYRLLTGEVLRLDRQNPQVAARMLVPLTRWRRYTEPQAGWMHAALTDIRNAGPTSADVHEILEKSLELA